MAITTLPAPTSAHDAPLLELDPRTREVLVLGREVTLTPTEHTLLEALAERPAAVLTKARLLRDVWHFQAPARTRTVDTHACRLRRSLGDPRLVLSVRGVGYRLCRPADAHLICLGARSELILPADGTAGTVELVRNTSPGVARSRIVLAAPGLPHVLVQGTRAETHDALTTARGLAVLTSPAGAAVSINPAHVALVADATDDASPSHRA